MFDRQTRKSGALDLSRRGFLIASAASGLVFAFTRDALGVDNPTAAAAAGAFEPTIWYQIDAQGTVTVNVIRAEWANTWAPRSPASSPMNSKPTGAACASGTSTATRSGD